MSNFVLKLDKPAP